MFGETVALKDGANEPKIVRICQTNSTVGDIASLYTLDLVYFAGLHFQYFPRSVAE